MQEGRTKKTAKNAAFAIINQFATIVLSFFNRTIFIRVLGAGYLGISGLFSDILTMLSLADLGLASAMAFSYYRPLAEGDSEKVAGLLSFYKKIYYYLAAIVAIIGVALVPFLKYLINLEEEIPYLNIYYLFFLTNTVVSYLFVYKTTLITADQKNYLVSKYTTIISLIRTLIQAILLFVFKNYFVYIALNILATLSINLVASNKANQLYPYIMTHGGEIAKSEKKDIFDNIKSVFIYKTASVVMNGTDNTLISVMVGTVWVGVYSNYNMIVGALNTFINLIYSSSTASIGNIIAKEEEKSRFRAFKMVQTLSLLLTTFTTICLSLLLNDFINVWLGENYVFDVATTVSIIVNFYIVGIVHPIWSFREATGLFKQTKFIMPISALVNISLSIILGMKCGVAGILFASAISRLTTYFWYEPRVLFRQYFGESEKHYYQPLLRNFAIVLVAIVGTYYASSFIKAYSWMTLLFKGVVVAIYAFAITVFVYRKTEGYAMIKQRVQGLISK